VVDTAQDLITELALLAVGVLPVGELVVELVSGGDDGWSWWQKRRRSRTRE